MFTFPRLFLLIACCYALTASAQTAAHAPVDTTMYSVIKYNPRYGIFNKSKPASLSVAEINDMESLVDSACAEYNRANPNNQLLSPISQYRRQYVAAINEKGEKEVWINFFFGRTMFDWKHTILVFNDGGTYYFQLRINLSQRKAGEVVPNNYE